MSDIFREATLKGLLNSSFGFFREQMKRQYAGPGLAAVGPTANYFAYNPLSKIVLSLAMLLGRLEIFPLLLTLSPSTWIKR